MDVPLNRPVSIGFSSINNPFWGTNIYGNLHSHGGSPTAGWFINGKSQSKMDDLGVPLFQIFQETSIYDHK